MNTRTRDPWTWAGIAVVGAAAAIMSFTALSDLAERCGIGARIPLGPVELRVAWLLPLAVDVLAAVATRVWLQRRVNDEALVVAQRAAWASIAATVVGNAAHGLVVWSAAPPPWWAGVVVSAVPAAALGAIVHLAVLVGRGPDQDPAAEPQRDRWAGLLDDLIGEAWDRPVRAWAAAVEVADRTPPSRDEPDEVLAADLRWLNGRAARPLGRDAVMSRYGIGSGRAERVRGLAEVDEEPAAVVGQVA